MCVLYRNLLTFPCSNTPLNDLLTNISCFLFKHIHCFILTLIHIYSFLYLYTFVTSNTDIHLIIHVHTFIHTCTYIHTTHTHTLVHKCMRARTHIHTHTHTQPTTSLRATCSLHISYCPPPPTLASAPSVCISTRIDPICSGKLSCGHCPYLCVCVACACTCASLLASMHVCTVWFNV